MNKDITDENFRWTGLNIDHRALKSSKSQSKFESFVASAWIKENFGLESTWSYKNILNKMKNAQCVLKTFIISILH